MIHFFKALGAWFLVGLVVGAYAGWNIGRKRQATDAIFGWIAVIGVFALVFFANGFGAFLPRFLGYVIAAPIGLLAAYSMAKAT